MKPTSRRHSSSYFNPRFDATTRSRPRGWRSLFLVGAVCGLGVSGVLRAQSWSAGTFPNLQSTAGGGHLVIDYQGPPPVDNNVTPIWDGYPANMTASQQINFLLGTSASFLDAGSTWTGEPTLQTNGGTADGLGTTRAVWVWANRRNALGQTNYTCNLIAPSAPNSLGVPGITLRRTAPLPWQSLSAAPFYQAGEVVQDTLDSFSPHHSWRCKTTQTSASSVAPHSDANWEDVTTDPTVLTPACRFEYKTFASATASSIVQARWLSGEPAYQWTGSSSISPAGFIDTADAYGLDVYSFNGTPTNIPPSGRVADLTAAGAADIIFTLRPLAVDKAAGANVNFAVKGGTQASGNDGVYLQVNRLADLWDDYVMAPYVNTSNKGGSSWQFGQIVRDQQNILPDNFSQYDVTSYTASLGGLKPPAFTGTFQTTYQNGHAEKYVELVSGASQTIRHRYPLPADSSSNYLVTVTGFFTSISTVANTSRIFIQATGLTSTGTVTTTVSSALPALGGSRSFLAGRDESRQFTLTQLFNQSGATVNGIAALAFPTSSDLLRFGVTVQNGTAHITSVLVQKIVSGTPLPTPTYWQCIKSGVPPTGGYSVTAPSSGTDFVPFAAVRAASPTGTWQPQKLALQLDYEVSDSRPIDPAHDSSSADGNVIYLFSGIHTTARAHGYDLFVYTNDIDQRNGVSAHNSLTDANLDGVLANVDKLVPVVDEANYRGNSAAALFGAAYNTLRYTLDGAGNFTSTPRANFSVDKVGFAVPLSSRYLNSRAPATGVSVKVISGVSYYQIAIDTSVAPSGTVAGGYIDLDGFAPPYDALFNGRTFHVKQGGTSLVIDQIVDYTDPQYANGVLIGYGVDSFLPSLPIPTYVGGGIAGGGGATKADFQFVVDNFIKNSDVNFQIKHWDLWRLFASQSAYENQATASSLAAATAQITQIRRSAAQDVLIVTTDPSAPSISGFPAKVDFKGNKIYSVTLDGITDPDFAALNGCTFEPIFSGTDPDGTAYTTHRFGLRGFKGAGFGLAAGTSRTLNVGANAIDASTLDVNRKIGTLAFGATP
ncbi:MAG TPA: hypothetical protein VNB29_02305 [Chthoniobacterales bacterium]|nr:hypothetical protein [Chthoniobacterales bacterium]